MGRNMLVDGSWHTDVEPPTNADGEYERVETTFRDRLRDAPDAPYRPEPGRYHLYVSRSCPWAHGVALVRRLLGLDEAISMDVVNPVRIDDGWEFSPDKEGCTADSILGADYLREIYVAADPAFTGRVTVPVLWDRELETIVNNESIEIMRMLSSTFEGPIGLYPAAQRDEIDRLIDAMYGPLNNGVYRAGFASSQSAYEAAVRDVFEALEQWDEVLADRRYLLGDRLTLADLRLFPTLVRFDEVYHTHFKCNVNRIVDYDNLWPYLRDLYQVPGVADTVDMDHIKQGYTSGGDGEAIIPVGPDPDFEAPHNRDRLAEDRSPTTGD